MLGAGLAGLVVEVVLSTATSATTDMYLAISAPVALSRAISAQTAWSHVISATTDMCIATFVAAAVGPVSFAKAQAPMNVPSATVVSSTHVQYVMVASSIRVQCVRATSSIVARCVMAR